MYRFRRFLRTTIALTLVVMFATFVALVQTHGRADADPTSTFSGNLTSSSGQALVGMTVSLKTATSTTSVVTGTGGSFSVSVVPGMYSLSISWGGGSLTGGVLYGFTLSQPTNSPGIDLTAGNVTQNLILPVAKVDYIGYNDQGYPRNIDGRIGTLVSTTLASPVSLYPGDVGMSVVNVNSNNLRINGSSTGSFISIVGVTYQRGGFCFHSASSLLYNRCNYDPITVTSGTNLIEYPTAPPPRNTFSGKITDQDNNPIVGATVKLTDAYNNTVTGAASGADGSFSVAVEPGTYRISNISTSQVTNGMGSFILGQTGTPTIDLTTSNVTRDLAVPVGTVYFATHTSSSASISATGSVAGTISLYPGDPGQTVTRSNMSASAPTGNYTGSFKAIVGTTYAPGVICMFTTYKSCIPNGLTVGSDPSYINLTFIPNPTLTVTSPTQPSLSWTPITYVTNYIIYRDGVQIGTSTGTAYVDNNVAPGSHTYTVVATDSTGATSNINSTPANKTITVTASIPTLGTPVLSANPIAFGQSPAATIPVSGNLYGISGGEYFIGSDPGQGNGSAMTYTDGTLTGTITGTVLGTQTVSFRLQNATGWSPVVTASLKVIPAAPTGLNVPSPTPMPVLSWDSVTGAVSYNVYRDGTLLTSVTGTTFTDKNVSGGLHDYYVAAVDDPGDEGVASSTANVAVDLVGPVLGTPSFSVNPVIAGQTTVVTVQVTGNLYGIVGGEYYIGTTDPGQGTAMTYSDGVLTATLSGLVAGDQIVNVRAQNSVGWGNVSSATLTVAQPVFSGTLTDSNGHALVGMTVALKTASTTISAVVGSGGSFSIAAAPGMYSLSISSPTNSLNNGLYGFTLSQSTSAPGINLTNGNLTQNLVLPVARVDYIGYNEQGYPRNVDGRIIIQSTTLGAPVSLYPGDAGATVVNVSSGSLRINGNSTDSFTSIVGVTYAAGGGFCFHSASALLYDRCSGAPYTVTSGANLIEYPSPPPARNTFSGALTDQNGNGIGGVEITLADAYGNSVTRDADANGNFAVAVEPGLYRMTLRSVQGDNRVGRFTISQTGTPTLDLASGNLTKSLVIPVATIYYQLDTYHGGSVNAPGSIAGTLSLYDGDPGWPVTNVLSFAGVTQGAATGSLDAIIGTVYAPGTMCQIWNSYVPTERTCSEGGLTVGAGPYYVDLNFVPKPTLQVTVSPAQAVLTWNAVTYATNYIVYRNDVEIANVSGTTYAYTDTGVAPGSHTYAIVAADSTGSTSSTNSANRKTVTIWPATPTGLDAASPTIAPNLSWNAVAGAVTYKVYRNGTLLDTTPDPTYVDTGAVSGTYSYFVTAVDALNHESAASNTIEVVVEA